MFTDSFLVSTFLGICYILSEIVSPVPRYWGHTSITASLKLDCKYAFPPPLGRDAIFIFLSMKCNVYHIDVQYVC